MSGFASRLIVAVTLRVPDLDEAVIRWWEWCRYDEKDRGRVPATAAQAWGASKLAGQRWSLLVGERPGAALRLVEDAEAEFVAAAVGWLGLGLNAANAASAARERSRSAYANVGQPGRLEALPELLASEGRLPGGARLAFVEMPHLVQSAPTAPRAAGAVTLVELGVPDLDAARVFYSLHVGGALRPIHPISGPGGPVRASAMGLSNGALLVIREAFAQRREREGQVLSVTFAAHEDHRNLLRVCPSAPSTVVRGPAGELLEFLD